ncbi:MAG: PGPGW domain-containing protein [Planctomycetota bacterium]
MSVERVLEWLRGHGPLLEWLGTASVVMFVGSVLLLPVVAARIPADFFVAPEAPPSPFARHHPVLRVLLHVVKNVVGAVLLLGGIAMLVLPGQGLLTILAGLFLLDLPGKRAVERRVVANDRIRHGIDWLRARAGAGPLVAPEL